MEEALWVPWIGMPQLDGADPRDGRGACCFRMTQIVREAMGLYWPADLMNHWYGLAQEGRWDLLREAWEEMTFATEAAPGAFCLLEREAPPGAFGLGVLVNERILLTALHERGVVAVPRSVWKGWGCFREVAP